MSEDLGDAVLTLRGDGSELDRDMDAAEKGVGRRMKSMGAGMMKGGAALTAGLTLPLIAFGKVAAEEMGAIEQANNETAKSLERMGEGSLISVAGVQSLAGELQSLSGIDDQLIQTGQNAILALGGLDTTTKQGAATFRDASKAMVDMAEAIPGMEVDAAGKMIAKALADPEKAAGKLAKAGVRLTEQQQEQIKTMTEAGNTAGAQAVIVEALGKKFEGAANLTNADKWAIITDRFAGMGAELLTNLLPVFEKLTGWLGQAMDKFDSLSPKMQMFVSVGLLIGAAMGPVLMILGGIVAALPVLGAMLAAISLPVVVVVGAIVGLGIALTMLWRKSETFREIVTEAFDRTRAGVEESLDEMKKTFDTWVKWAQAIWREYGDEIVAVAKWYWNLVSGVVSGYLTAMRGVVTTILALLRGDWQGALDGLKMIMEGVLGAISAQWSAAWTALRAAFVMAWDLIKQVAEAAATALVGIIVGKVNNLIGDITEVWTAIRTNAVAAWGFIREALAVQAAAAANTVKAGIDGAIGMVTGVWNDIRENVGVAWGLIKEAISTHTNGAANTVKAGIDGAIGMVTEVWSTIRGGVSGAWALISAAISAAASSAVAKAKAVLVGLLTYASGLGADMAKRVKDAVNKVIDQIRGMSLPTVKVLGKVVPGSGGKPFAGIPRLADGGVVTDATIAMIGEGRSHEAVVPLDRYDVTRKGQAGVGAGITQNFYVTNPVEDLAAFMDRARTEMQWAGA